MCIVESRGRRRMREKFKLEIFNGSGNHTRKHFRSKKTADDGWGLLTQLYFRLPCDVLDEKHEPVLVAVLVSSSYVRRDGEYWIMCFNGETRRQAYIFRDFYAVHYV